jgi:hypothetical protein
MSSFRGMQAGVAQGGLISPVPFRLYVNDKPTPSHHFELVLYADDTAIIATSCQPKLLVSNLEIAWFQVPGSQPTKVLKSINLSPY